MEIKREKFTFKIPDRPTVRQQLQYFSAASGEASLIRYWEGAKALIEPKSWQSEALPNYDVDLDTVTDPSVTNVLIEAGLEVLKYMNTLEDIPKN